MTIKSIAARTFPSYSYIHNFLKINFLPKRDLDFFIAPWLKKNSDATIFQIGANDGIAGDPFFKYIRVHNLKNLAVEPIPFLYEILKTNYTKANLLPNCTLLNLGISTGKEATIYYFEPNPQLNIPENIYQLGTFNRSLLDEAAVMFPKLNIVSKVVPTCTVADLQQKYFSPDVIHIDTEGYDFEVIKTIDFSKKPKLIIFEFIHLSNDDVAASKLLLQNHGYKLSTFEMDIVAEFN